MYSCVNNRQVRYAVWVYIDKDQLAATPTASAFALIGQLQVTQESVLMLNLCTKTVC